MSAIPWMKIIPWSTWRYSGKTGRTIWTSPESQHISFTAGTEAAVSAASAGNPWYTAIKRGWCTASAAEQMEYPKICPAVIVGIVNGDKILMSTYANSSKTSYALIAGFAEIGETIEDTVRREVMEEVGLKVKNIRFYKSQPWSFTDTLSDGILSWIWTEMKPLPWTHNELIIRPVVHTGRDSGGRK
jgi:NADH pyrophosphatase NudC (nudix superfamily)